MREILFRGKRIDNGEWVYGDLRHGGYVDEDTQMYIMQTDYALHNIPIIPETLGQYTGLKDKNGKKIFEGDTVNVYTSKEPLYHKGRNLVIKFDEYHRFVASGRLEYPLSNNYEWEVIGNIHDNPKLLGVE